MVGRKQELFDSRFLVIITSGTAGAITTKSNGGIIRCCCASAVAPGAPGKKETEVSAQRADDLVQKAYSLWINDSFWLNPVVKIYDQGVTRSIVKDAGGRAQLLVEYSSGGLTPGDAYLWTPGPDGMPPAGWRIWARTLTIKGLPSTWENWTTLSSGAKISTLHRIGPWRLRISDVAGARTLAELLGTSEDPFAALSR